MAVAETASFVQQAVFKKKHSVRAFFVIEKTHSSSTTFFLGNATHDLLPLMHSAADTSAEHKRQPAAAAPQLIYLSHCTYIYAYTRCPRPRRLRAGRAFLPIPNELRCFLRGSHLIGISPPVA
jgi:hypothetical protein